jgi:hypothetical protein
MRLSDPCGFEAALETALNSFDAGSRRSGRTTRMLDAAQDGDLIVVVTMEHAVRLQRELREAGKTGVRVVAVDTKDPHSNTVLMGLRTPGSVHLDHVWVMEFFRSRIRSVGLEMDDLCRRLSRTWPPRRPGDGIRGPREETVFHVGDGPLP